MLTSLKSTKDKLLRAALVILARDGMAAATTAAIAEEAGVAEGALYRQYKLNDDLLIDAHRADLDAFQFGLRFGESALASKEGGMAAVEI